MQVSIHVLDAEAKKLCVMAWWWKGRAVRGSARERRAACARAIAGARMPATELRKAGKGGTERARRELSDGCCCDGDANGP